MQDDRHSLRDREIPPCIPLETPPNRNGSPESAEGSVATLNTIALEREQLATTDSRVKQMTLSQSFFKLGSATRLRERRRRNKLAVQQT